MTTQHSVSAIRDVLVSGGGPVGATLALALAQRGFAVDLVEAAIRSGPAPRDGRAVLVAAGCWRIFAALGLGDRLAPHAQPVHDITAQGARDREAAIRFTASLDDASATDGALGYMIELAPLVDVLDATVRDAPGIRLHSGVEVTAMAAASDAATVQVGSQRLKARVVAACEGRRSRLRDLAGIRYEGRDYGASAISALVRLSQPHHGEARQVFLPTGPLAVLPLPDNRANIVWSLPSEAASALMALDDGAFAAELAARAGGFVGRFELDGQRLAWPLGRRVADRFHADRLVLAGDAAHLIHPLAGQGLNLGLKDVASLVDVLAEADRVGLDPGRAMALEAYTRVRRPDALATAAAMEGFHHAFTGPVALRGLATAGMKLAGMTPGLPARASRTASASGDDLPSLMQPPKPAAKVVSSSSVV